MPVKDMIIVNAKVTTLDRQNPVAGAIAIRDGRFLIVGDEAQVRAAVPEAETIDVKGRRVIPGLIDSHTHIIRGGLNYNMELRWDGVPSLFEAMAMLKAQVDRTPAPQWVRVMGGFTEHQLAEKRTRRGAWRQISSQSSACWRRTGGPGDCTPPTMKRSIARLTCSRRSTATCRSQESTGSSTMPRRSATAISTGSPRLAVA